MSTTDTTASLPAPAEMRRDEHGRLVAAHWAGGSQPASPRGGRWLVAFDGSPMSLHALEKAIELVGAGLDAAVDVVHVHPWLAKEAADSVLLPRAWEQTQPARDRLARAGVAWRLHVEMGEPATRIVALAQQLGSAGIVMGSHGHGAVDQLMLGSVSYKVLHLARMPVLIVR